MAISINHNKVKQDEIQDVATQVALILKDIRFGSVEVVVHDGRVVQIDKRERYRLNEPKSKL